MEVCRFAGRNKRTSGFQQIEQKINQFDVIEKTSLLLVGLSEKPPQPEF